MSYKTSRQKTAALAVAVVAVAAALVAAVSFAPASASAQERPSGGDVSMHRFRAASGAGVATDIGSGEDFRSGIRAIWTHDDSTGERAMSRGSMVISVGDERVGYQFVPGTWQIDVAEDGLTFEATGQVEDSAGKVFDVSLNGYLGGPVGFKRAGTSWSVDGEMTGGDAEYDLHYVMLAHLGSRAIMDE